MSNNPTQHPKAGSKRVRVEASADPVLSAANDLSGLGLQPSVATRRSPSSGPNPTRVQIGTFGSLLAKVVAASKESGKRVLGSVPVEGSASFQSLQLISTFLAQHRLAQQAQTHSSPTKIGESPYIAAASYYLPTLNSFAESQLDRQAAGLRTNANRETASGLTKLVESHAAALEAALMEHTARSLLSNTALCTLHKLLCPALPTAGTFRTTRARAGHTLFCPPEEISKETELFWSSLVQLQEAYLPSSSGMDFSSPSSARDNHTHISRLYYSIALAATTMYGINDIHPFSDGNGRTSRIYVNGLLKNLIQLPFTITIAATPQQRQEYIDGIRSGQRRLDEENSQHQQPSIGKAMEPLIHLVIERISHAVVQVQSLLLERARAAEDEEEARIARRVRERAAQGQCIICLDNSPNIATLCCGQAVHLNCIAEWLANGTTCVYCRTPLPRLKVNNQGQEQERNDDPRNLHDAFQAMQSAVQRAIAIQNNIDGIDEETEHDPGDYATTTSDDDDDDGEDYDQSDAESTTSAEAMHQPAAPPAPRPECLQCRNVAATDCDNGMCGRCCGMVGQGPCNRHGTQGYRADDTTEDDEDTEGVSQCIHCYDIAAAGCSNEMCRNCCLNTGDPCGRHRPDQHTTAAPSSPQQDTTDDEEDDDDDETQSPDDDEDTTTREVSIPPPRYCGMCPNRAALDCANGMCGRCCVLSGVGYRCDRHSGAAY